MAEQTNHEKQAAAAKQRKFDVLVIFDYDRLARTQTVITALLAELESYVFRVESVRPAIDFTAFQ